MFFVSANTTNQLIDAQQETSTPLLEALKNETLEEGDSRADSESEMSDEVKAFTKLLEEESPEYKAQQALKSKLNELQEKFYLECIVNKESGEFKNTIDCMTWSQENAQIQLGIKK
ncbi:MAG TPA: hypothetical protein VE445_01965 [Nitrososphaeraceae archaeon]|nr:hypothetical protein [Nitrososphaeraceae archaeon]